MANKKISDLNTAAYPLNITIDEAELNQAGNSVKAPVNYLGGYEVIAKTDNYIITEKSMRLMVLFTKQASSKNITLPNAIGNRGQAITIVVSGVATGNVALVGTGGQTINGIVIGSFVWEGKGNLTVVSDGTNYQAINSIFDSGTNSHGKFCKHTDGSLIMGVFDEENINIGTADTGGFRSTESAVTYPVSIAVTTDVYFGCSMDLITDAFTVEVASNTTNSFRRSFKAVVAQGFGTRSCRVLINAMWV